MKKPSKIERGLRTRRPANDAEGKFYDQMTAAGWTLTKRGWPDFFCVNDAGEICAVEVKPHTWNKLKREQLRVAQALQAAGIDVYKWTPDSGFTGPEYVGDKPER